MAINKLLKFWGARDRAWVSAAPSGDSSRLWTAFAASGLKKIPVSVEGVTGFAVRKQTQDGPGALQTWLLIAEAGPEGKEVVLDVFLAEEEVKAARDLVVDALVAGPGNSAAKKGKVWKVFKVVVVAVIVVLLLLIVIGLFFPRQGAHADEAKNPAMGAVSTLPPESSVVGGDLASAMGAMPSGGVSSPSGRFDPRQVPDGNTIAVGTAGKPRVLVFSDPLCEYCRDAENKVIPAIAGDYDVRIVPVPAKGPNSATLVAQAFCAKDPKVGWAQTMRDTPVTLATRDKKVLTGCVMKGMQNYVMMRNAGIDGTPTFVAPDGRTMPQLVTADQLRKFLQGK